MINILYLYKNFGGFQILCIFANLLGKMAERSNAAVLKTVDLHGSGGSNPSLSAEMKGKRLIIINLFLYFPLKVLEPSFSRGIPWCWFYIIPL